MKHSSVFRTLELPGGTLVPFASVPGERVRVLCGRVWLTEEGSPHDAFLGRGEELSLGTRGLAVIEALSTARIQLLEPVSAWSALRRIARRLTHWLSTLQPRHPGRPIAARAAGF